MTDKNGSKQFKDVQTDKRIHEHLSDEKDIISEEDVSNVRTDITSREAVSPCTDPAAGNLPEDENLERKGKKTGRSDDPGITTSWNILNE